jgi:hypothetical protein
MLQYFDLTKDKLIKRTTLSKDKTKNTEQWRKQSNNRDIQRMKWGIHNTTEREFYIIEHNYE